MNKRQIVFTAAKIIFAAAVLTWLLHSKVKAGRVWDSVSHAHHAPIIAGVLLCWLTVAIAGWRWHCLLEIFEITMPLGMLICIAQIGQFFLMFLPGPIGDDATRMLYISRVAKGRVGEACTSVLLDRFIGLASILLMAVFCIPWQWTLLAATRKTYWMSVGILTVGGGLMAGGIVFFLVNEIFLERFVGKWLQRLPASNMRTEFLRINTRIFTNRKIIAKVMGAAMGTQLILCVVFYLAGRSVGIHASFATWIGFVPIVLAANTVPITVAGIGVREYLVVLFLGVLAYVEPAQALAASLITFSMMLAVSLLGGVVYIFYKPAKKKNASAGAETPAAPV